jgi:hypothetical protein
MVSSSIFIPAKQFALQEHTKTTNPMSVIHANLHAKHVKMVFHVQLVSMAIFYMQNSQVTSALRDLLVPTVFT